MANFNEITQRAFDLAINEAGGMSREDFRVSYGFGKSTKYVATFGNIVVDPKPLLASAHYHQFPGLPRLTPYSFSSSTANRTVLENFGCKIVASNELPPNDHQFKNDQVALKLSIPANAWWANQSDNFNEVFEQGTLWVPRFDERKTVPSHWATIHELLPGDLVLHRHAGRIRGLSTVISTASIGPRPSGYTGGNDEDGFLVWLNTIGLVDIPERTLLDQLEAGTGPVNQQSQLARKYLSPLPIKETVEALTAHGISFGESSDSLNLESNMDGLFQFTGPTDRQSIAQSRLEQRYLRTQLFAADGSVCGICGEELPGDLLVAGHIKPRSVMTEAERLDFGFNAMLVCVLGCDALYERGYISVDRAGYIRSSEKGIGSVTDRIARLSGRYCPKFGPLSAKYFNWHWENIFNEESS